MAHTRAGYGMQQDKKKVGSNPAKSSSCPGSGELSDHVGDHVSHPLKELGGGITID